MNIDTVQPPKGMMRIGSYPIDPKTGQPDLSKPVRIIECPNLVLHGGADIQARILGGDVSFKVQAMYFEYENLASPGDLIVPPVFDRTGGLAYYQGLAAPKDYLRVPITVSPSILSSDTSKFAGNQTTFFAFTGGSVGVNGQAFEAASDSTVYGVALAATPDLNDPSQDIVFARAYFPGSGDGTNKFPKEVGHAIALDWAIRFN